MWPTIYEYYYPFQNARHEMLSFISRTAEELSRDCLRHRIETSRARKYRIEKNYQLGFSWFSDEIFVKLFSKSSWNECSFGSRDWNTIAEHFSMSLRNPDVSKTYWSELVVLAPKAPRNRDFHAPFAFFDLSDSRICGSIGFQVRWVSWQCLFLFSMTFPHVCNI